MAYNQYSGYGGNPYGGEGQQAGGYGSSNPYGSDAGNPYGGGGYGQVSWLKICNGTGWVVAVLTIICANSKEDRTLEQHL